jgi:TetR/AcrR family transcriptional regulator, cholesterol catabolism regulator
MQDYRTFKKSYAKTFNNIYYDVYLRNQASISIKKAHVAVDNLKRIFEAALRISNRTGFHSMSLRDLSNEAGISMGALYSYIESKEKLLSMILTQVIAVVSHVLADKISSPTEPLERLRWLIQTHIYLSDVLQPWFFFAYMEAKTFDQESRKAAIESELLSERLLAACIEQGRESGVFVVEDPLMTAALIKPLLQDWYLKRWKYSRRNVSPDMYAAHVVDFVEAFLTCQSADGLPSVPAGTSDRGQSLQT